MLPAGGSFESFIQWLPIPAVSRGTNLASLAASAGWCGTQPAFLLVSQHLGGDDALFSLTDSVSRQSRLLGLTNRRSGNVLAGIMFLASRRRIDILLFS